MFSNPSHHRRHLRLAKRKQIASLCIMPTLVIKSVPAKLHARLKRTAAAHRRSLTQETMHLLEMALAAEESAATTPPRKGPSYWGQRSLVPAYASALAAGAFADGQDSTAAVSTDRDAR